MVDVTLEFDTTQLERIVERLRVAGKDCGIELRHLVWEQAADACNNLVKHTAPIVDGGGSYAKQKKAGETAVAAEIDRLFAAVEDHAATWDHGGKKYVRLSGTRVAVDITDRWQGDKSAVETAHKSRRLFGRGGSRGKSDWTKKKVLNSYRKEEKKHVGMLKAGWVPALMKYAGKDGKSVKVPAWITRHDTPCGIGDSLTEKGDGAVSIQNQAKHNFRIPKSLTLWVTRLCEKDAAKWLPIRAEKIAKRIAGG